MLLPVFSFLCLAIPVDSAPMFTAFGADGYRAVGRLVRLDGDRTVVLADSRETFVRDILSIRRSDRSLPPPPTGPQLITTSGDRILGTLAGGDAQSLRFNPAFLAAKPADGWRVPLSACAILWLTATPAGTPIDPVRYEWVAGFRNRDVVRFRNGDVDKGTLAGCDPEADNPTFAFRPEQGQLRSLQVEELAAIAFNPSLSRFRKPKGAYVSVTLADASRLHLLVPTITAGVLSGETLFGLKVRIPVANVLSLDVMQGKAAYLSDRKPSKVEEIGFLGTTWSWAGDRSVTDGSLRLPSAAGETVCDKGLGTHPRSKLTYNLGGKYRRFEAVIGLDPASAVRGQAAVRIFIDGKERAVPGLAKLSAGTSIPVAIDLAGAKELVLVTDFGPAGGVGADVTWGDARLVE